MPVKPTPDGYHTLTPYLIVKGGVKALEFYKKAFHATELMRFDGPNGTIGHSEIKIGDSVIMVADEFPGAMCVAPTNPKAASVGLMLYVDDCDAWFSRAVACGATVLRPLADQFYGDRSGTIVDPFNHQWTLATHKEDLTHAEIETRMKAWEKKHSK